MTRMTPTLLTLAVMLGAGFSSGVVHATDQTFYYGIGQRAAGGHQGFFL